MSLVLAFWLVDATDFLRATAGVTLAHSTMDPPEQDKTAEHLDPARAKEWVPAEPTPRSGPGEVHRDLMEALDLAGAGGRLVDIAELERRVDDANDATSRRR
jgi:hypothetical protein